MRFQLVMSKLGPFMVGGGVKEQTEGRETGSEGHCRSMHTGRRGHIDLLSCVFRRASLSHTHTHTHTMQVYIHTV